MAGTGEDVNQSGSQGAGPLSTVHLYYADTELFSHTARVIAIREAEVNGEKLVAIVTDETVMHPQGGKEVVANMGSSSLEPSSMYLGSSLQGVRWQTSIPCDTQMEMIILS